jgi:Na+/proline symporter
MSTHIRISTLDLRIIIAHIVAILAIGILSTRRVKVTGQVFLLAGRSLPWGIVGAAIEIRGSSTEEQTYDEHQRPTTGPD